TDGARNCGYTRFGRHLPIDKKVRLLQTGSMAKKHRRSSSRRVTHRAPRQHENYLVVVRGWMLVVAFALMLGIGAMVGQFINDQLNASTPTVAGAETSR